MHFVLHVNPAPDMTAWQRHYYSVIVNRKPQQTTLCFWNTHCVQRDVILRVQDTDTYYFYLTISMYYSFRRFPIFVKAPRTQSACTKRGAINPATTYKEGNKQSTAYSACTEGSGQTGRGWAVSSAFSWSRSLYACAAFCCQCAAPPVLLPRTAWCLPRTAVPPAPLPRPAPTLPWTGLTSPAGCCCCCCVSSPILDALRPAPSRCRPAPSRCRPAPSRRRPAPSRCRRSPQPRLLHWPQSWGVLLPLAAVVCALWLQDG